MARLIDAEAVLEFVNDELKQWRPPDDPMQIMSNYSHGRQTAAKVIKCKVMAGDFDPPKFSAEAVDSVAEYIGVVEDGYAESHMDEEGRLCHHLIEYLTQLRETK